MFPKQPSMTRLKIKEKENKNWLCTFIVNKDFWLDTTSLTLCNKYTYNLPYHCRNNTNQLKLLLPTTSTRNELLVCLYLSQEIPILRTTTTTLIRRRIISRSKLFSCRNSLSLQFQGLTISHVSWALYVK